MRAFRWLLLGGLIAIIPIMGRAAAPVPPSTAGFYGIGDLAGGPTLSLVRDAVKAGGTIYAVGGSAARNQTCPTPPNCFLADTPVLWTWDGTTAALAALPNLVVNTNGTSGVVASAISPNAAFIAGQARSTTTGNATQAVQITTSLLTNPGANVNLNASPFPVYTFLNGAGVPTTSTSSSSAISSDGSVVYGSVQQSGATLGSTVNRAVRFDVTNHSSELIPLLSPGVHTTNLISNRGTSADGSVAVGTSSGGGSVRAFRFVVGGGVTAIPLLPGGTTNRAMAVSPDGNLTLVAGASTDLPKGELYIHNATTNAITRLGSANTAWNVGGSPGMTANGAVVASSFSGPGGSRTAYFHNAHGWFHLTAALAAAGSELPHNWEQLQVSGISADGTLVFGQGTHNNNLEGYVAEFPAGFLENFNPLAVPAADGSIIGAWRFSDPSSPGDEAIVVFQADGTYFEIESTIDASDVDGAPGFERGRFYWDPVTGAFDVVTMQDTNGDVGLSDTNGRSGFTLTVAGDNITFAVTNCVPDPSDPTLCSLSGTRIAGGPGSPVGAWFNGDAKIDDSSAILVLLGDGSYYFAQDGNSDPSGHDGIERGTWAWNQATGEFVTTTPVDTNGEWGLSDSAGALIVRLSADELSATATDNLGSFTFVRVVNPELVKPVITSPLTGGGTLAVPFSYTVTATHGAFNFDATGLPAGLSINSGTGLISGTPTAAGTFPVTLSASNTLATGTDTLSLIITNTPTGSNVAIEPVVPPGAPSLELTFGSVTEAGATTVTVIDPATTPGAPPPPSGFALGDPPIYYHIETTATFAGEVTVCLNYTGATFGAGTPRLFHFTGGVWTDITTSVDTVNNVICGLTSSFSPFAIFVSPITRTGFYAPVSSVAGAVNTVKGGSTVPLKFNVYVNGVEKTDTTGLTFGVWAVACSNSASEDPVDFTTTGGTSLRYDTAAGSFVQNWKTPKAPGCYFVRMTTVDGLSIGALFKVK